MFSDDKISQEEWRQIVTAPYIAAAVVSAADHDRVGRNTEDVELAAYRKFLASVTERKRRNPLVDRVVEVIRDIEPGQVDGMSEVFGFAINQNDDLDNYVEKVVAAVEIVRNTADKADAKSYVQFILEGTEIVAKSYNESEQRLGNPISTKEGFYLRKFRTVL